MEPQKKVSKIDLVPGTWYLGKKLASADLTSSGIVLSVSGDFDRRFSPLLKKKLVSADLTSSDVTAFGGPEMAFGAVWRPLVVPGR